MEIVQPSVEILTPINREEVYRLLELCGRTAYKSEAKITEESAEPFLKSLISKGHESVIEHFNITVKFICDRGVSHELVRHRIASYTQESTRYCNYSGKGIQVIKPPIVDNELGEVSWYKAMESTELYYNELIAQGESPQIARSVLPNSLKTEVVATMNIRQWRHVLRLRTAKAAHPQIRELMCILLDKLQTELPVLFQDIPNLEHEV